MADFKISEKEISNIADSHSIFQRGRVYARQKRVKLLKISGKEILSEVKGKSGTYEVEISLKNNKVEDFLCDCPYGGDGCKHVVAVLYQFLNDKERPLIEKMPEQKKMKEHPLLKTLKIEVIETFVQDKKNILDALKLIDKTKITSFSHHKIESETIGKENYNTTIEFYVEPYYKQIGFFGHCSCGMRTSERCEHVLAAFISIFKLGNENFDLASYEEELKARIQDEEYLSLVGCLERLKEEKQQNSRSYLFYFKAYPENNGVALYLEKAAMLKGGGLGRFSETTEKFLRGKYNALSEKERIAFEFFIASLKTDERYYYGHLELKKNKFSGPLDSELLKRLKELYHESPASFANCSFPLIKAQLAISLLSSQKGNGSYSMAYSLKLGPQSIQLQEGKHWIFGAGPLWLCYKEGENAAFTFVEMECDKPKLVAALFEHRDAVIAQTHAPEFIKKYFPELSEAAEVVLPEEMLAEEKIAEPKPRIFLSERGGVFPIELRFLYGITEVSSNKKGEIIVSKDGKLYKVKRELDKEEQWRKMLLGEQGMECVFYSLQEMKDWLTENGSRLATEGFEIYGADALFKRKVRFDEAVLNLEVSSGVDWFDLKGDVSFGNKNTSFSQVLDAIQNNEGFVKLSDGTEGIIPKKWLDKLSYASGMMRHNSKEEKVRAARTQIALIEELLKIANKKNADEGYNRFKRKFEEFKEIKEMPLPSAFKGTLRDYQKAGYNWLHFLKEFSFGGCLADDMGLGKTAQVLCMLLHEKEQGNTSPNLVVVPTSLVFNWLNEVKKFAPVLEVYTHHGLEREKSKKKIAQKKTDIVLTTYGTLRNDAEFLKDIRYHYIILDESQSIKNPLSKNSKSVFQLSSNHRIVLTGTPIENKTIDLWSQFAFLNPGLLGNMEHFKRTFASRIENSKDKEKAGVLKDMISPFLLRRKKENVMKELPDKQIITSYCEMEPKQREFYESWREKVREEIKQAIRTEGLMRSRIRILAGLTRLRQICNHPKLVDESFVADSGKFTMLLGQVEEVINEGHKCLLFSSFTKALRIIEDSLKQRGIRFSYLDGSTTKRKEVVDSFQNDPSVKVFLISLKAGGLGLNLTAADYVFIIDPWWNPATEMQAIDRAHRIGQDKKVFVYKLITKDSVEEKILELQQKKLDLVKDIITVEAGIFKQLDKDELLLLFER